MTSMATSHTRWAVVMSRNAGFIDQCVELDFQYPSEGIHRRWDAGSKFPPLTEIFRTRRLTAKYVLHGGRLRHIVATLTN